MLSPTAATSAPAFVTGGSGFLGRHLIAALRAEGRPVRALARSEASARAVREAGADPVAGDLDDEAALREGMRGCDRAFHAAAYVKGWGPREEFHRATVQGTERVIAAARAAGVRRLVHVSTEAVLAGGGSLANVDETRPRPRRPVGLYPWSKGLAEARVEAANGAGGLETVIVRPRFIWGAGDTSLLPQFEAAVKEGRFAWIAGGRYPTQTCHVRNVCEGALEAALRGAPGAAYFLTDGAPVEMRAFLTAMLATRGVDPGAKSVPRWVARLYALACEAAWTLLPLAGEPPLTRTALLLMGEEVTPLDARARREIGYEGRVTREAGLAEMRGPGALPS